MKATSKSSRFASTSVGVGNRKTLSINLYLNNPNNKDKGSLLETPRRDHILPLIHVLVSPQSCVIDVRGWVINQINVLKEGG